MQGACNLRAATPATMCAAPYVAASCMLFMWCSFGPWLSVLLLGLLCVVVIVLNQS